MHILKPLQAHPRLEHLGWRYFAEGSYNFAYISQCGQYVLKIPKKNHRYIEDPRRSLEVFCEIHPEWAYETKMFYYMNFTGWIMPYFKGRSATDLEISQKLVDIYQRTSRIILDASANQNFICTPYDEVVCIDVGFAFRIQSSLRHSASDTSLIQWSQFKNRYNHDFFVREQNQLHFPQTIRTIKALLFLQTHLPDFTACDFIIDEPHAAQYLSDCYDKGKKLSYQELEKTLDQLIFYSLDHLKQRCIQSLMNYIQSHCLLDQDFYDFQAYPHAFSGQLKLSWLSYFLFNHELIERKIRWMQHQIQNIISCQSKEELKKLFQASRAPKDDTCCLSLFDSTFQKSLDECQHHIENQAFLMRL